MSSGDSNIPDVLELTLEIRMVYARSEGRRVAEQNGFVFVKL
jgi:hypothetical protein